MKPRDALKGHAARAHADISPSGAERWWNCPGSVALITKLAPPETTNIASETGTAAHELLEKSLRASRAPIAFLGHPLNKAGGAKLGHNFVVDRGMAACVEEAIDYIQSLRRPGDTMLTEQELQIPATGQPGHVDVAIFCKEIIDVIDYKHGTNPVEVKGNKQAMLYALGVVHHIRQKTDLSTAYIKRVRIHIIQPRSRARADGASPAHVHELTMSELTAFYNGAKARVLAARSPNAPLVPGEVQCHYCPVRGQCPALAKAATQAARLDFEDVISKPSAAPTPAAKEELRRGLTNKELGRALTATPLVELWLEAVRQRAVEEICAGRKVPGFKLVEGRSNRKWMDEEKVRAAFRKLGIPEDDYAPRRLVGIGDGEDLVPKAQRQAFMTKLAAKPPGKPCLAPDGDPRPAFDGGASARNDFGEDLLG